MIQKMSEHADTQIHGWSVKQCVTVESFILPPLLGAESSQLSRTKPLRPRKSIAVAFSSDDKGILDYSGSAFLSMYPLMTVMVNREGLPLAVDREFGPPSQIAPSSHISACSAGFLKNASYQVIQYCQKLSPALADAFIVHFVPRC